MNIDDSLLWQIRHFVYGLFADTTLPPSMDVTAAHFNISNEEASEYYKELHNRHAFILDLDTLTIRMANPFSGISTEFKVHTNGKTYYANCAWDMLGIPAALHTDAVIEAVCTESNETVRLEVNDGHVTLNRDSDEGSLLTKGLYHLRARLFAHSLRSGLRVTRHSSTFLSPSPAGTMTWSSPERRCCSSSRKNGLTNGANEIISNAEKS